ncbi:MAG: tRNA lysidine(34) synthetase TilS [Candidatus Omnitrophota bacterium]
MLLEKIEGTIRKFNMLTPGDRVLIALSGGPDSVALAYLLKKMEKKWRLYLHLAHLNHMLRKDAGLDAEFARKIAKRLCLPLSYEEVCVRDFAREEKLSVEEAARKARYNFLSCAARKNSLSKIALGHQEDDQAETILMRFLRGSGLSGLRGMPVTRKMEDCLIIRPLMEVSRKEILRFLSAKKITYRIDSSNLEDVYCRNKIRNKLIPYLEKEFNPRIKETLVTLSENVAEDFDFLEEAGKKSFSAVSKDCSEHSVALDMKKFLHLHKALQKQLVRLAITRIKGDVRRIDFRHWKELEDMVEKRPKGTIVDLPAEISAVKKEAAIVFYKRSQVK